VNGERKRGKKKGKRKERPFPNLPSSAGERREKGTKKEKRGKKKKGKKEFGIVFDAQPLICGGQEFRGEKRKGEGGEGGTFQFPIFARVTDWAK